MDISYFQKINNTYKVQSRQETDLYLLNRHVDECFADTIDYHVVKRNGKPFELLIIKDADSTTFKKKIKSKHSAPFNLGDYIEWDGKIWLITQIDSDDKTYHSGYMYLCTIPLRWQNSNGKIVERYACSEDSTKYSSGTNSNNALIIGDNQYGLTLPIDRETKKLHRDMRFPIDFDDLERPEVYQLTNRRVLLRDNSYFGRGGLMDITLSYNEFNITKDKKVKLLNNKEVWICDYIAPDTTESNQSEILSNEYKITYVGQPTIRYGGRAKTFKIVITDENGDIIQKDVTWKIKNYCDGINVTEDTNELIQIKIADDDSMLSHTFTLEAFVNDELVASLDITIVD